MARISKSPEERKREIMLAAKKLFVEKGYDSTSVEDIVKEVGIAKGTFYYHFKSKDELVSSMFDIMWQNMQSEFDKLLKEDMNAIDKLNKIFQKNVEIKFKDVNFMKEMANAILHKENKEFYESMLKKYMGEFSYYIVEVLKEGQVEEIFDVINPEIDAQLIISMISYTGDIEKMKSEPGYIMELLKAKEAMIEKMLGIDSGSVNILGKTNIGKW